MILILARSWTKHIYEAEAEFNNFSWMYMYIGVMLSSTVCKILIAVILLSGARHGGGRVVSFFAHLFRISILSLHEKNR